MRTVGAGGAAAMEWITGLPIWAQAQTQTGAANPSTIPLLALRRWCGGLTLSSPRTAPSWHGVWALLAGLAVLLLVTIAAQGPSRAFRQLVDLPGHFRLLRDGLSRMRRAAGVVAALIGFAVVSWTGAQALVFDREDGRTDLLLLTRSRGLGELSVEQGSLAGLTPLRDVAGLADNLPLLLVAVILLFRASIEPQADDEPGPAIGAGRGRAQPGWLTLAWGVGALYILYRVVSRAAGSPDLPVGNCLVVEAILVPLAMAAVDGLLLAWLMVALRNAGLDSAGESRLDPSEAAALMPAAILGCVAAVPARYLAAFVLLANDHLPTSVQSTQLGSYIRWQLGDWGLADVQAAALVVVGMLGVIAWTRGRLGEVFVGYGRLLAAEGGRLIAALLMAAVASGVLAASAYAIVLLLPVQSWVLNAADSYAHYATIPVSVWLLAALVELGQRSLPTASPLRASETKDVNGDADQAHPNQHDPRPPVAAPSP